MLEMLHIEFNIYMIVVFVLTLYDVGYYKSEAGVNEDWDDSQLTKDEADARLRKKVEAVIKRERAMAYAYSHKVKNWSNFFVTSEFTNGFLGSGLSCLNIAATSKSLLAKFNPRLISYA